MTNQIRNDIEQAVKAFRKKADAIQNSDNPIYKDKDVVKYEIDAARAELDAFVAEKSNEFDAIMTAEVEKAEAAAQQSRFYVTETQKAQAMHSLDAFVADVTLAYDDDGKHAAYSTLERRLDTMTAAELSHVRLQLPQILQRVGNDEIALKKLRSLNATLAALQTPEQERLDELREQKRVGPALKHTHLTMTHPAYSQRRVNQHNGGFMQGK